MATLDRSCDICVNLHVRTSASVWCSECEEAICNECEPRHQIQKATKNHKTIPIADYQELPESITNIKLECEDHNQKLVFYCSIHSEACCTRCVSEKHKDCRELKPLAEVVEGMKSSAVFSELEDRVKDLSQFIELIIQEKLENKSNLGDQRIMIITEVERVRNTINTHLSTLQDDLLNTVGANEQRQLGTIDYLVQKLSKMKANVDEIAHGLEKTKKHASNFQTFLAVDKWTRDIENEEMDVKTLEGDQNMANVQFQININPMLDQFVHNVVEFGTLEVNKFSPSTKLDLRKDKQGQELSMQTPQYILSKIKCSKLCSFDIPKGKHKCMITGCAMFEDERIVFADCCALNSRLVVLSSEGCFIKEIKFEDRPLDVTIIDSNTVATTLYNKKIISIIDVNSSKTLQTIHVNGNCYGICSKDKNLVICLDGKIIKIVDLSGKVLSKFSQNNCATYCSVMNNKICYAAQAEDVVYCSDLNGNIQWKVSCEKSDFPNGLTHDASGNVFVTCRSGNKVIVIESRGTETKLLLTSKDGPNEPKAIHYNHNNDRLIVCNASGQCFLYKITN
ncbi:uncharacterized protein [Mytilus edulis]|uniref:uncharacterized protein n=1 Tax=Mytilus edulis TaxID=6550 RepID=UPI0039EFA74E